MRILMICLTMLASPLLAQDSEPAMTGARMNSILLAIDPEAVQRGITTELTIDDVPIMVIVDEPSDRMRAMVPIRSADGLEPEELQRMMQANFDTALDARYAVAQGRVWGGVHSSALAAGAGTIGVGFDPNCEPRALLRAGLYGRCAAFRRWG